MDNKLENDRDGLLPEEYPEDVCHEEHQAHVGREALGILGPADVSVLRNVRNHPAEHHGTGGDPGYQAVEYGHDLVEHLVLHDYRRLALCTRRRGATSAGRHQLRGAKG